MVSSCKNMFYYIVLLQVVLTWVAAQGDLNVTSPAELLNSSLSDAETGTPPNVQNDQQTPQKLPEIPTPTAAAATEPHEETPHPTRQPNVHSTASPPVIRPEVTAAVEPTKNGTASNSTQPPSGPSKKGDGGHAGISVANVALVVFGVTTLLVY